MTELAIILATSANMQNRFGSFPHGYQSQRWLEQSRTGHCESLSKPVRDVGQLTPMYEEDMDLRACHVHQLWPCYQVPSAIVGSARKLSRKGALAQVLIRGLTFSSGGLCPAYSSSCK